MRVKCYSINDVVSKEYFAPFTAKNDDVAKRVFVDGLRNNPHPEDYRLYFVGEFDDELGVVFGSDSNSLVCSGVDFVSKEEK